LKGAENFDLFRKNLLRFLRKSSTEEFNLGGVEPTPGIDI